MDDRDDRLALPEDLEALCLNDNYRRLVKIGMMHGELTMHRDLLCDGYLRTEGERLEFVRKRDAEANLQQQHQAAQAAEDQQ